MRGEVSTRLRTTCSLAIAMRRGANSSARSSHIAIERLQMATNNYHEPVMVEEVLELFRGAPRGVVVDGTLGGAGHARALLSDRLDIRIVGIDRDPMARATAAEVLAPFGERTLIVAGTFSNLKSIIGAATTYIDRSEISGILLDLGVSSRQLDDPMRGFSFRADAPLDMRMDPTSGLTAREVIERYDVPTLTALLRRHGETRFANAIAKSILDAHPESTHDLVNAVDRAVPKASRRRGNVATRVFQALRVVVNDEEFELRTGLGEAISLLSPGGVLAVISYHSGEDRTVKEVLLDAASGGCTCPPQLDCVCGAIPSMVVTRASALLASEEEVSTNPRARSARLRYGRKVA